MKKFEMPEIDVAVISDVISDVIPSPGSVEEL